MSSGSSRIVELLATVPVFEALSPDELTPIAESVSTRRLAPQEVMFREGERSDTCVIVVGGHARSLRAHADGRRLALATFGPGDVFGELAMFEHQLHTSTVQAVDAVEALEISGSDMRDVLRRHPAVAVKLVCTLGRRLQEANERLARQSFQTVQSRVAAALGQLVAQARAEGAGERDVLILATQAELAALAGSSRESASRFLASLERARIISQGRGRLVVHEPTALGRYVY